MVGGKVIESCEVRGRNEVLWLNCADFREGRKRPDVCSVLVERTTDSEQIEIGDRVWWQSGVIYWTPQDERFVEKQLKKIGGSGVTYETACGASE
jgi:hypothetical protein